MLTACFAATYMAVPAGKAVAISLGVAERLVLPSRERHPGREAGPQSTGSLRDGPAAEGRNESPAWAPTLHSDCVMNHPRTIAAAALLLAACSDNPVAPEPSAAKSLQMRPSAALN